jgi:hypothetical protein
MLKDVSPIPLKQIFQSKKEEEKARDYDNNNTLSNSVRNNQSQDFWLDFKAYLIAQRQSKRSIKNKLCYTQRFNHILEQNDAHDLLELSYNIESLDYVIEK